MLCAVAGFTPRMLDMVGLRTPIYVHPLQAMVSEPLKPWLDPIIVSGSLHVYVSQSARGELVMGASLDPYELHSTRSTLDFVEALAAHMLDLFPFLTEVKVNRQWAGLADMTPDFAPIMGLTPVEGFYLDAGWGTWGFKATPVCGKTMSHTVANGGAPTHSRDSPSIASRATSSPARKARRRWATEEQTVHEAHDLPVQRPARHQRIRLWRRVARHARPGHAAAMRPGPTTCSIAIRSPA